MTRLIARFLAISAVAASATWVFAADAPARPTPRATTRPSKPASASSTQRSASPNSAHGARGPQVGQGSTTGTQKLASVTDVIQGPKGINYPVDPHRVFFKTSSSTTTRIGSDIGARGGPMGTSASQTNAQENARRQMLRSLRPEKPIPKGSLTPDEVSRLQVQETSLQSLERNFQMDGTVTKDESNQLSQALGEVTPKIWTQLQDPSGQQKSIDRFGNEVIAKTDLTQKLQSGDMTRTEARQFLGDLEEMAALKRRLSTEDLTEEKRTELEDKYAALISHYYQSAPPHVTSQANAAP